MKFIEKLRKWCGIESTSTETTEEVIKSISRDNKGDFDVHILIPIGAILGAILGVILLGGVFCVRCADCATCGGCTACIKCSVESSCCQACVEACDF